jgi:signal transduction histidine kinase
LKEVSCRFFDAPLRDLRDRGIDPRRLVEGTEYSPSHLAKKDERIEWAALVRMMENARQLWTREELVRLGERGTEGPLVQFIGVIARLRFSVAGFYDWVTAPDGVGGQMITCVKPMARLERPGRYVVDFHMLPGYAPSDEFFLITQGTYAAMPRMLGAPMASIDVSDLRDGVRFTIQFEEPKGVLSGIRRAISWPFTLRQAATELGDAHASLLERYRELDQARLEVERQRALLDLAYQVGQQIWAERDPARVGHTVARALVDRRDIRGVRLVIDNPKKVLIEVGALGDAPAFQAVLPGSPRPGHIDVWANDADGDTRRLVGLLAPTIALALDNAAAYHELAAYQAGLEKLVDERTAELRQARDELTGTVERLREAQRARETFFANISHEIRTPLSLIVMLAGIIERREGGTLQARSVEELGAVTAAARKLVHLVDELLLLAAGQADKLRLSPEMIDLAALIGQIATSWRPAAEAAGLELEVRVPDGQLARVDPVQCERAVTNLVSNAVKYTPRGGRIELELAASDDGGLRISVLDTGPGISEDLRPRLFGRFERAHEDDRHRPGTGIGLALVKQLVEAHGGTVSALARPTGGTELRVLLPASGVSADDRALGPRPLVASLVPPAPVSIASGTTLSPAGLAEGTILIAEDDPQLAEALAQHLSDKYTVVVALDGAAAAELVARHQPQLLVTDVDMPGMNGIELARRFREITGDKLAPILILSAVHDLRTRLAGLEAGAVDYVTKPFDPAELRARVHAQFRMRELAMRLHRAEHLSALGILTSGLAHELRNPANGIVNAIGPLVRLLPPELARDNAAVRELLEVMQDCADQIAFLARQLLGFRSDRAELDLRPAKVPELVQRALTLARKAVTGVEVKLELGTDAPVTCAPPLIVQILNNLIENAGHAAGKGGWVEVKAHRHGDRTVIEVADSGPGVPGELHERVFEPFFTTKPPGIGNGLGLSVSRGIAHRHGGVLEIRERDGRAVFVLELPHRPPG